MTVAVLLLAVCSAFAEPDLHARHEVLRLTEEMERLAERNAWVGVERMYDQIAAAGGTSDRKILLLAADAARHTGDVVAMLDRLAKADLLLHTEEVQARMSDLLETYGRVQLVPRRRRGVLVADERPFRPDAAAAIEHAQRVLDRDVFDGFLPVGSYQLDGVPFSVQAHEPLLIVGLPPRDEGLEDLTVEGVSFPRKVGVGGTRLALNGVGVRAKFAVNVYVAALYLERPTYSGREAIEHEGPKRLVMHFVYRRVTAKQMEAQFRHDFERVQGAHFAAEGIEEFLGALQDMERGDRLTMEYVPDRGTEVSFASRGRVLIEGEAFMEALFGVFLGEKPPTNKLKDGLTGRAHVRR